MGRLRGGGIGVRADLDCQKASANLPQGTNDEATVLRSRDGLGGGPIEEWMRNRASGARHQGMMLALSTAVLRLQLIF
jgi:hypothetical protein